MVTAYMRVGRKESGRLPAVVVASHKPSNLPVKDSLGNLVPTVAFAIELNVPDEMFDRAEQVIAELTIDPDSCKIAAEVKR